MIPPAPHPLLGPPLDGAHAPAGDRDLLLPQRRLAPRRSASGPLERIGAARRRARTATARRLSGASAARWAARWPRSGSSPWRRSPSTPPRAEAFTTAARLPMRARPASARRIRSAGRRAPRAIHVVDASCFPSVPGGAITFPAMANAHRIATACGSTSARPPTSRTRMIAVTGANGYVGGRIISPPAADGVEAIALVRRPHAGADVPSRRSARRYGGEPPDPRCSTASRRWSTPPGTSSARGAEIRAVNVHGQPAPARWPRRPRRRPC